MEMFPPSVNNDRALALASPIIAMTKGSGPQIDQVLVDATVEGVSRDDPPPPNLNDESTNEVETEGSRSTTKR